MKRTDEMRLGEKLHRPTCFACGEPARPYHWCAELRRLHLTFEASARELNEGVAVELLRTDQRIGRIHRNSGMPPEMAAAYGPPPPTTEYPSDRRKDPVQRFSMAAQLQLMKALAILGWVAFFLELLRV